MKIRVLSCQEMIFKNGDKLYKITGLVNSIDVENVVQICFSKTACIVEEQYNVRLVASGDMKSLKCVIGDMVVKSSEKGIFNK